MAAAAEQSINDFLGPRTWVLITLLLWRGPSISRLFSLAGSFSFFDHSTTEEPRESRTGRKREIYNEKRKGKRETIRREREVASKDCEMKEDGRVK